MVTCKVSVFVFASVCTCARAYDNRAHADGFIEALAAAAVADRVVSRSDCSYRRGSFVFSHRMWGRQAGRLRGTPFTILKVQDGFGLFNFLSLFFFVGRGGEIRRISIRG